MNHFSLHHENSKELDGFPRILEFFIQKCISINLNSLSVSVTESIRIYYIVEGKFEWIIDDHHHILYPGDVAIILPGQSFRGEKDYLDIGTIFSLHLRAEKAGPNKSQLFLGTGTGLTKSESTTIGRILQLNTMPVIVKLNRALTILQSIQAELFQQQIGYSSRVNHLIDELLIIIARHSTLQNNLRSNFQQSFMKLEQALRQNLANAWTVEEMAAMVGLGTTSFTEKVKNHTGFTPSNYLINIRISEAIKLLKKQDVSITSIALETGFYSSQHFSTTFKKLTGYTPNNFRKRYSSTL